MTRRDKDSAQAQLQPTVATELSKDEQTKKCSQSTKLIIVFNKELGLPPSSSRKSKHRKLNFKINRSQMNAHQFIQIENQATSVSASPFSPCQNGLMDREA